MPLSQEEIKKRLKNLSIQGGGSLVRDIKKARIAENNNVLFIGLGGMGCKTINKMKELYTKEFVSTTGKVRFFAVDTDDREFESISVGTGKGYVSADEQFSVFCDDAINLLYKATMPNNVRAWIGDLEEQQIDSTGAKQQRQVGRVMLCGTHKYRDMRTEISNILDDLSSDGRPVHVVLVSGIAGGTGSGTFVDVSVMVRKLLDSMRARQHQVDFYGVFYAPDAQRTVPAIANNNDIWECLCRNGYAAMKELDYFINGRGGREPIYRMQPFGMDTVEFTGALFEANKVFMVSATNNMTDCDEIIASTANNVLNLYQTDTSVKQPQSFMSSICNALTQADNWKTNHVGKQADNSKELDICGADNTKFPAYINYSYSAFGYSSIYFPRDEIMTYCANTLYGKVADKWKNAFTVTNATVETYLKNNKLATLENYYDALKSKFDFDKELRIDEQDDSYPYARTILGLGKTENVEAAATRAKEKADNFYNKFVQSGANNAYGLYLTEGVRNALSAVEFLKKNGPYICVTLLAGHGQVVGCIDRVRALAGNPLQTLKQSKQQSLRDAQANLGLAKDKMASDINPTAGEIKDYINACYAYSEAYFEYKVYNELMSHIVEGVANALSSFNNDTFTVYTTVMDALKDMLNADSQVQGQSKMYTEGNHSTYSMNVFELERAKNNADRLEKLFEGYINTYDIDTVSGDFIDSIFGNAEKHKKWMNFAHDLGTDENEKSAFTHEIVEEIREIFKKHLDPMVNNALEKFVVLTYVDGDSLKVVAPDGKITMEVLDKLWNDPTLKSNAITSACNAIKTELENNLTLAYERSETIAETMGKICLSMPKSTPAINAELTRIIGAGVATCEVDDSQGYRSVVTLIESKFPIAIPLIKNMREYAKAYFKSDAPGKHLDEKTEKWMELLPELYGVDMENYFDEHQGTTRIDNADRVRGNCDERLYKEIKDAVEYGIEKKYIYTKTDGYYMRKLDEIDDEIIDKLAVKLSELRLDKPEATWVDALDAVESEESHGYSKEIRFKDYISCPLETPAFMLAAPKDVKKLKNVYRVVRNNINLIKLVLEAKSSFDKEGVFDRINGAANFDSTVELFMMAVNAGMISKNDVNEWECKCGEKVKPFLILDENVYNDNELDTLLKWYIVFAAFAKKVDAELKDCIENGFIQKKRANEIKTPADFVDAFSSDKDSSILKSDLFSTRPVSIRDKVLNNLIKLSRYHKDGLYNVNKVCVDAEDLVENVTHFSNAVEASIK